MVVYFVVLDRIIKMCRTIFFRKTIQNNGAALSPNKSTQLLKIPIQYANMQSVL